MAYDTIITISRQYGSGGRFIGRKLAEALDIPFYDKELITMSAEESGMSKEIFEKADEKAANSLLYTLSMNAYLLHGMAGVPDLPLNDKVFLVQSEVIRKLAAKGPCVIVGRCGDYVLRDRKDVLRIFVYAPKEWRLAYGKENNMLQAKDEKGIKDEVEKTDRNRSAYYNYYTQNRWGDAHNYDLAINAALGRETCVKMILDAVAAKEKTMAE